MEKRKAPRHPRSDTAQITLLSSNPPATFSCHVVEGSQNGLKLRSPHLLPVSSPIRLDIGDELLLGEIVHCVRDGESYLAGLRVEQSLAMLGELRRLMQSITGENRRASEAAAEVAMHH